MEYVSSNFRNRIARQTTDRFEITIWAGYSIVLGSATLFLGANQDAIGVGLASAAVGRSS